MFSKSMSKLIINSPETRKKVVIVGDSNCGKSSMVSVYLNDHFPTDHQLTCFDSDSETTVRVTAKQMCNMKIGYWPLPFVKRKRLVKLSVWDTNGQEAYNRLRRLAYPDTDVVIICFSIVDPPSFYSVVENWAPEIKHFCPDAPIILVGMKEDLRFDPEAGEKLKSMKQGPILYQNGENLADDIKAVTYLECSAKDDFNINEVFSVTAKVALEKKRSYYNKCKSN